MAAYNGERYIEQQIESILLNMTDDDELIISDDGSTDRTLEIVSKYINSGFNIKIIQGPGKGVMKNFENAIWHAEGEYIFLSDQDDVWLGNKEEEILKLFHDNNSIMLIVNDVTVVDKNNNIIIPSFFKYRKSKRGVINNIICNSYLGCAMCFKAEMKEKILPIPTSKWVSDQWHDQWIGLISNYYGKVFFCKSVLGYYRRHENNKSSMKKGSIQQMIINRIVIISCLLKRIYKIGWGK